MAVDVLKNIDIVMNEMFCIDVHLVLTDGIIVHEVDTCHAFCDEGGGYAT